MKTPKLGGWRAEAPDANDHMFNDHPAKMILKESPQNGIVDLRKWCSPVEDQRDLGSCVANAVVGGLELLQIRNGQPLKDLSRLFVYYNSRLMHQQADVDEGTYIRLAMGTLSALGTCSESKWPYDTSKVFYRPSWGSYREAYANKIQSYYRIDGDGSYRLAQINKALEAGHPVVFGCMVDNHFMNTGGDGKISMPQTGRVVQGGHAMLIVGYKDFGRTLIVRNSWGTGWGDNGYCYMPDTYLDATDANDFWVPYLP